MVLVPALMVLLLGGDGANTDEGGSVTGVDDAVTASCGAVTVGDYDGTGDGYRYSSRCDVLDWSG